MGPDGLQLVLGFNTSAGEQVASWAPGAIVFKTLNTTGAGKMAKAAEYPVKPVMLVAGDDAGSKLRVMELVGKLGFEAVDAGPLKNALLLELLAMALDRPSDEAGPRAGLRFRAREHEVMSYGPRHRPR